MISYEPLRLKIIEKGYTIGALQRKGLFTPVTGVSISKNKDMRVSTLEKVALFLGLTIDECFEFIPDKE